MNYRQRMEDDTRESLERYLVETDEFLGWTGGRSVLEVYRRAKSTNEILEALDRAYAHVARRMGKMTLSRDERAEHATALLRVNEAMALVHVLTAVMGGLVTTSRLDWVLMDENAFHVAPQFWITALEFADTSTPWAIMSEKGETLGRYKTFAEAFLVFDPNVLAEKFRNELMQCSVVGCNKLVHVHYGVCTECHRAACSDHVMQYMPEYKGVCLYCGGLVPKDQIRVIVS